MRPPRTPTIGLTIIAALAALALIARIPPLGQSLWYDEIAAWRDYAAHGPSYAFTRWHDPANHVLQSALSAWSVTALADVIGEPLALRLPSLIASLLLVPALAIGLRPVAPRLALLAGIAAALMPVLVLAGTEARGYPFMVLGATASSLILARRLDPPGRATGARRPGGLGTALAYAGAITLGTWGHLCTALVALGHAVVVGVLALHARRATPVRRAALPLALGALGCALVLAPVIPGILRARAMLSSAPDAPGPSPFGEEGRAALLQVTGTTDPLAALFVLPLLAVGIIAVARQRPLRLPVMLLVTGALLAPPLLALGGSWMYARFLLFTAGATAIVLAAGAAACMARAARRAGQPSGAATSTRATAALALALPLLALIGWQTDLLRRPPRQPLREAAALARAHLQPGERILVIDLHHRVLDPWLLDLNPVYSLRLGEDLERVLRDAPPELTTAIVLYPDLVPASRVDLLKSHGFRRFERLPGWIDHGRGAVEVWRKVALRSANDGVAATARAHGPRAST